jgi:hypothetical protein
MTRAVFGSGGHVTCNTRLSRSTTITLWEEQPENSVILRPFNALLNLGHLYNHRDTSPQIYVQFFNLTMVGSQVYRVLNAGKGIRVTRG